MAKKIKNFDVDWLGNEWTKIIGHSAKVTLPNGEAWNLMIPAEAGEKTPPEGAREFAQLLARAEGAMRRGVIENIARKFDVYRLIMDNTAGITLGNLVRVLYERSATDSDPLGLDDMDPGLGADWLEKCADNLRDRLLANAANPEEQNQRLARAYYQNLTAYALQDMEEEVGAEQLYTTLSAEEFDRLFDEHFQQTSKRYSHYLITLWSQDLAREVLDQLNPAEMPLEELINLIRSGSGDEKKQTDSTLHVVALDELAFIPSNPLVAIGLRGLWSGGPDWQRKRVWHHNEEQQTAQIVHRPKKGGNIRLEVAPTAGTLPAVQAFTALDKYLSSLSAFTSDIALLVLAALGKARNPMVEPIIISAAYIRQAKGDELYGRQREKFDARVAEEMENLKRFNFSITAIEVKDPESKRWRAMSWKDDRLFDIVTIEEHQGGLYGEGKATPVAWTVRAGQWAYWFLNPQARQWVAGIASELFALSHRDDRRAEQLAKKIGQFVALQGWKTGKGQPLRWTRKTLLEQVGENMEVESRPARLVDALESALIVLKEHGIFHDICSDEFARKQTRGWITKYLSGSVEFVPTREHTQMKPKLTKKRKAKKSMALPDNLGDRIKQARENQDLNQAALARHLKISRQYLSEIENGKREPSAKVLKTIKTWLEAE